MKVNINEMFDKDFIYPRKLDHTAPILIIKKLEVGL